MINAPCSVQDSVYMYIPFFDLIWDFKKSTPFNNKYEQLHSWKNKRNQLLYGMQSGVQCSCEKQSVWKVHYSSYR